MKANRRDMSSPTIFEDIDMLCRIKHSSTVLKLCQQPTNEALGMEEKMMMPKKQLLGHMPVYHFIGIIWQQYIHRSPRKASETTSGWFFKVISLFSVFWDNHIVWAAILFPKAGHPYNGFQ